MQTTDEAGVRLSLADLVLAYRSEANLSQEALAERAGLSTRTVSDIECGVARAPRAVTLSLLAEALHLPSDARDRLRLAARPKERQSKTSPATWHVPRLIGRESDVAAAVQLLRAEHPRLVTFVGPPGVGKTSLALRVGADATSAFSGGSVLVELAPLSDASFVPTKIALALGVRDALGESLLETLAAALRNRSTLLLLDNLEHLSGVAAFVSQLLTAAPGLTILGTSRVPLHIKEERVSHVAPLAVPQPAESLRAADLGRVPTVRLLVERAKAVKPDFALTTANSEGVAELAAALEGLPLAVELAAPHLRIFSPAALARRLSHRLPLLETGRPDVPARQRTMRAAIAWSYDLLEPRQQRLLRRVSVFRSSFMLEAAQAVVADGENGDDALDVLRTLAALVDHNLVGVKDETGEPLFQLSPLVREFAHDLLVESNELDYALRRLARYCLPVARLVNLADPSSQRKELVDRLERDSLNFNAVLEWAQAGQNVELGLRLAVNLWPFWWYRGSHSEGLAWLRALFAALDPACEPIDVVVLADAYHEAMALSIGLGAFTDAETFRETALELKGGLEDRAGVATLIHAGGVIASECGDYERAQALFQEALELRRAIGVRHRIATSLLDAGQSASHQGEFERGAAFLEECLQLCREDGAEVLIVRSLAALGLNVLRCGEDDRAGALSSEALRIARKLDHTATVAYTSLSLGIVALHRGALDEATSLLREACAIYEISERANLPLPIDQLAAVAHARGQAAEAARLLGAASALRDRMHVRIVPADRPRYEALVAALTADLGHSIYAAEWTIGNVSPLARTLEALR
jgi:predicted ATPase/DNA-binding XRE family transcriptional regulator